MANIMQQVKLKNHTSRDAFDLSHRNAFTAKVGELLPVSCMEVIPGDSYKLEVQHFTRTMPVNTAAYTRIREYYDWFFVPTDLLWNKFGSFVTQMVDNNQHASGINTRVVLSDTHPYFTTTQLHDYIERLRNGNSKNLFGFNRADLSVKLLNYLDYGNFTPSLTDSAFALPYRKNASYNPFPLLAYQKIYQDYFRNSQWEKAYAPSFNIDYMSGASGLASLQIPINDINITNGSENMFDLRYANWHKDLFMGLLPNAQYGAASIVDTGSGGGSISVNFGDTTDFKYPFLITSPTGTLPPASSEVKTSSYDNNGTRRYLVAAAESSNGFYHQFTAEQLANLRLALGLTTTSGNVNVNTSFSILALRQAEALQKWKEVTQSQQQDYKSQVEAHFGVSPDNGYSDMCRWIDGSVSTLDISEVTNTNITGDNAADIAGKGVGVGQSRTSFKSNVHGYLMCIYHAVPLLDYAITGTDRVNLKTKATDYAIPEFDRTGMVSIPTIELTNTRSAAAFSVELLGYAPRYYDYKQKIDRVHGAFMETLSPWVAPVSDSYILNYLTNHSGTSIDYSFFKINPATMNPIFALAVNSDVDTDQLLVNAAFDVKSVRNLDRNGLPY